MTATLLDRLAERLQRHAPAITAATPIAVGLSGGIDSVTLLAAMQRIGSYGQLRCIHIDHQLHSDSPQWVGFCRDLAARLGVEFTACTVECDTRGNSVEAAARAARYRALAAELRENEVLLTAHHGDDQLETLLYRLVRGTGVDGLRGIREFEPFARGYLMRPFLKESRAAILAQAQAMDLQWREDPSNADERFDRNFLRRRVLPQVLRRWPGAAQAAQRFAASAGDSAELAQALALLDLDGIGSYDRLPLERLAGLTPARQRNALRHAVRSLSLAMPDAAALQRICELLNPDSGGGVVTWPGAEALHHVDALYLRPARAPLPQGELPLVPGQTCCVAEGRLRLERAQASAIPDAWVRSGLSVQFRSGGEQFQPAGSPRALRLREWMRTSGLLPWMRDRVPLIFHGEDLVAVADLSVSEAASAAVGSVGGWRVVWLDRPRTH